MRKTTPWLAIVTTLCLLVGSTMAEKASKKGKTYYVTVNEEEELADGRILRIARSSGHVVFDDGTPGRTQSCFTSTLFEEGRNVWSGGGHCLEFDSDGDFIWVWLELNNGGNQWGYIQGTGKFAGIRGEGTSEVIKNWPDGNFVVQWEVEYEIP